eukprot:CAMPEP_0198235120 /NCGR_PEP_ID=MMETSP1446-20131203/1032_1 /TAXON_ID=1461542 ORGANISM="Unidentified sp, Strain CCMP2111" /NCGR_SAMPLE_ID=MMETSP1446 /ASSEMBLY_ACC=CAM_ASM_001112 /LENGTH=630 /DNA_ID=CAMNT_0043916139 /DNA_START=20 /DNA_END=1912 /DNA_ORIENTATION=+
MDAGGGGGSAAQYKGAAMAAAPGKRTTIMRGRRVTIVCTGSRGDVQPFVALARALGSDGYAVRVLVPEDYVALIRDGSRGAVAVAHTQASSKLTSNPNLATAMRTGDFDLLLKGMAEEAIKEGPREKRIFVDEMANEATRPDVLIGSNLTFSHLLHATFRLRIPSLVVDVSGGAALAHNPGHMTLGMPTLPFGLHGLFFRKMLFKSFVKEVFAPADKMFVDIANAADANIPAGCTTGAEGADEAVPLLFPEGKLTEGTILFHRTLMAGGLIPQCLAISRLMAKYTWNIDDDYYLSPEAQLYAADIIANLNQSASSTKKGKSGGGKTGACVGSHIVGDLVLPSKHQILGLGDSFGGEEGRLAIEDFLAKAEAEAEQGKGSGKVIYCGWGSMTCKSREHMVVFVAQTILKVGGGVRAIVLGGMAELSFDLLEQVVEEEKICRKTAGSNGCFGMRRGCRAGDRSLLSLCTEEELDDLLAFTRENILFVQKAPHEWLFPRVACTVHHGGAGTTVSAMRAGVPTIITPVFYDQWDHAYGVNRLGNGIGFERKQLMKICPTQLSAAIRRVVLGPEEDKFRDWAIEVAEVMRKSEGTTAILHHIGQIFDQWVDSADGRKDFQTRVQSELELHARRLG